MAVCPFNWCVDCGLNDRQCNKCGWNPDVAERRNDKLRKELRYEGKGAMAEK